MKNFIISTDSCVDTYKSSLTKQNVYCITMKRVLNGKDVVEHYDSASEFDAFYDSLSKGALPTTSQINPFEMQEFFSSILEKEKTGDIIHIPLSSGLSSTCDNAQKAAEEINKTLKGRKIFVVDSLIATHGMGMMIEELIQLRDSGKSTHEAIKRITELRDNMQGWVIMSDLFHLRRGGRISGVKATIGTILNVKPIITINKVGKLAIENKMRGTDKGIQYILEKMEELGNKANPKFKTTTINVIRTSKSKLYEDLKAAIKAKYPTLKVKENIIVGPIIGTHLGCNSVIVIFEGAPRLDIK